MTRYTHLDCGSWQDLRLSRDMLSVSSTASSLLHISRGSSAPLLYSPHPNSQLSPGGTHSRLARSSPLELSGGDFTDTPERPRHWGLSGFAKSGRGTPNTRSPRSPRSRRRAKEVGSGPTTPFTGSPHKVRTVRDRDSWVIAPGGGSVNTLLFLAGEEGEMEAVIGCSDGMVHRYSLLGGPQGARHSLIRSYEAIHLEGVPVLSLSVWA